GAIVRFWVAYGGVVDEAGGIYRIYIDGKSEPVIEMNNKQLVGGDGLVGYPFSFFAPTKTENDTWKGRNLILPIPYDKHCKVTYQSLEDQHTGSLSDWDGHYYQINYRRYDPSVEVESFHSGSLSQYSQEIYSSGVKLTGGAINISDDIYRGEGLLKAGDSRSIKLKGEKAITSITLKVDAQDIQQALRSTVLRIEFDGLQSVWVPLGQFFGVGYRPLAHSTQYITTQRDGLMTARWVMPFEKGAVVTIENFGNQIVDLQSFRVETSDYCWDDRTMHFYAAWNETRRLDCSDKIDYNFITLKGKGVFVADNLTVFNFFPDSSGINWWGEGDEKIYVDGEEFPSHFGTGTEDYYSYAWCRPQPFSNPITTQPIGEGNKTPGLTSNNRYRLLDAIPFTSSFKFDMEIWHPYYDKMNYSPTTFWYAFPDTQWNYQPDIEGVQYEVTKSL
ncbi:MAG: glycoside hydrolase family 172 protein, partial [Rikenellaceae bacterium]